MSQDATSVCNIMYICIFNKLVVSHFCVFIVVTGHLSSFRSQVPAARQRVLFLDLTVLCVIFPHVFKDFGIFGFRFKQRSWTNTVSHPMWLRVSSRSFPEPQVLQSSASSVKMAAGCCTTLIVTCLVPEDSLSSSMLCRWEAAMSEYQTLDTCCRSCQGVNGSWEADAI
jgi:hypothetical protein